MRITWFILIIGGLLSLPCAVALTLFTMRPEEAESRAAEWLAYVGFSEWTEGLTKTTDDWITYILWALLAVAIGLFGFGLIRIFRSRKRNKPKDGTPFDLPIREAVDHYVRTFPHSYKDGADQHAFEVFHKAMCSGELPVMGAKGEDGPSERISARQCKRLKPIRTLVPKNWASPQGLRFDLVENVGPSPPLEESAEFPGYTGLRVRSADLYRLWPKNRAAAETLESPWHEALERCHAAFLEYMKVPASRPISNEEIVATQAFLPHVHKLCRLLDEQGIPHLDIPDGLIFDNTGKWGVFMARLLAVRGDRDEARKVLAEMKEKAS